MKKIIITNVCILYNTRTHKKRWLIFCFKDVKEGAEFQGHFILKVVRTNWEQSNLSLACPYSTFS